MGCRWCTTRATIRRCWQKRSRAPVMRRFARGRPRRQGWLLGIGIAAYNEATGIGPHEGATVGVESDGRVRVTVGAPCQGQGHETTLAQVCADRLGVSLECVAVSGGDTGRFPVSAGTYASRVAVIVGNAVAQAADVVRDKARHVAARALECDPEDVVIADGRAHVAGATDRGLGLAELAKLAPRPDAVRVLAYQAVHDAGHEINPLVVEGQTQGGAVQGIGAALGEEIVYDASGQVLTGSLMDYALP